jgi:hypothetical protein
VRRPPQCAALLPLLQPPRKGRPDAFCLSWMLSRPLRLLRKLRRQFLPQRKLKALVR